MIVAKVPGLDRSGVLNERDLDHVKIASTSVREAR